MAFNLNFNPEWITKGLTEEAITFAQKFGEHLCELSSDGRIGFNAMTTSQIRNIFGEVKRIQAKTYSKEKSGFLLLKPKLAYAEARAKAKNKMSRLADFRTQLDKAHSAVSNDSQFQNFVDFLEAILAYHKFYGGRD